MNILLYNFFKILSIILLILVFTIKAIITAFPKLENFLIEKLKKIHMDYDLVMWGVIILLGFFCWSSFKTSLYYSSQAEKTPQTYIQTIAIEDVYYDRSTQNLYCTLPEEVAKENILDYAVIEWRRQVKPLDEEHPSPCYEVYESQWSEDTYVYVIYTDKADEINAQIKIYG